jgi:adenine-specific DNA-methyltransferase
MDNKIHRSVEKAILEALGRPAIHRPGVMIYQMDCVQALRLLPENLIDLTVTSPPYNIGKEYETTTAVESYVSWCESWIKGIDKVSKRSSAFWLNLGYFSHPNRAKCLPIAYLLWDKVPFFLLQEIVWNYSAGVATRNYFSPRNEKFLWYVKDQHRYTFNLDVVRDPNVKYPNQKKNGRLKCNPLGKNPTDVWEFPKVTSGAQRSSPERTAHPAQFPIAVIDRIVRACSNPGDILLDPFMGSGTTAEVGMSTGRFVLGFELESKYIEIINSRLEKYKEWEKNESAQQALGIFKQSPQLSSFDFG